MVGSNIGPAESPATVEVCDLFGMVTPRKFNMEPENHQLEKENTSSKSSFLGSMLVFEGVSDPFKGIKG